MGHNLKKTPLRAILFLVAFASPAFAQDTKLHQLTPVPVQQATAACYYVSCSDGHDQADGRTPQTAWRTLARVNAAASQPGDMILFQRDDVWRGQLHPRSGAAGRPVTYGAYGQGAKPILQGSVARDTPAAWIQAANHLWTTRPPTFTDGVVCADLSRVKWALHTEGGAAASLSGPEGLPPVYCLECRAQGARPNHIQLFASPVPVSADQLMVFHFRARSSQPVTLRGTAALITSSAPWTAYGHETGPALLVETNWTDLAVYFKVGHAAPDGRLNFSLGADWPVGVTLWFQPGQMCQTVCNGEEPLDVDIGNIIFDHGLACGVKKWRRGDLRHNGDFWYDAATRQVWLYADTPPAIQHHSIELALNRHIIAEGGCRYVTYEDLQLRYGAAHGIGGGDTAHITVRRCDISFIGGGHQLTRPDGQPVRFGNGIEFWNAARHNLVEHCRLWEIYDAALTNQGKGSDSEQVDITYRHNVIWNAEYSLEYWNRPATARTGDIVFEHNTCVDAGHGWGHNQRPDKNGRHLMFYLNDAATHGVVVRDNIFCNSTDSCLRMDNDWRTGLTLDHNLWFQRAGPLFFFLRHNFSAEQVAAYRTASGFDLHSLIAEPQFRNAAQCDYRLAAGSPGLNWTSDGQPCGALSSGNGDAKESP